MESTAFTALIAQLVLAIQMLGDFQAPQEPPRLAFLTQAELAQAACGRPCEIYGWFPPGRTIYLDQRLDPADDLVARSILVHELAHYLQQEAGAYAPGKDCQAWLDREWQAYDIQLRWLASQGAKPKDWARLGLRRQRMSCPGKGIRATASPE